MAKGNRKRANTVQSKNNKAVAAPVMEIAPLEQVETGYFNQLIESSNQYSGLLKQKKNFLFIIRQLTESRTKIQKDEIKLPVSIVLIPKVLSYMEDDKKKVLALFDKHIAAYQANMKTLKSQLEFAYENFTESGERNKEYFIKRFETKVKAPSVARIVTDKEEELFKEEYEDIVADSKEGKELREKLRKANREAVKRNTKKPKKQ